MRPGSVHPEDLARLSELAGLSQADLVGLESHAVIDSHPRDAFVFRRGDTSDGMYLVLEGQVALEIDGAVVGLVRPSEWFGELAVFTVGPRTADARVTVEARLARVDRDGWTLLAARSPHMVAALCERLSRQLRAAAEERRPSHTVVACEDATAWLPELLTSLKRQFPRREVQVVDVAGDALERTLAELAGADILVLLTAREAGELADRRVARAGLTDWTITPGYGGRAVDTVRGRDVDEALGRVARRLAGGTIGLALGAGGAYGFAHVGLIEVLDAAGIPIDYVAGTSMGAVIGACVAAGLDGTRMRAFAGDAARRFRSIVFRDLDLRGRSLLTGRAVMRLLAEQEGLRTATFESLHIPFAAVATDIGTGEEVVIGSGPLLEGIQPSFAMPGIFPPCERNGRRLIDGAMVNPVPVDRVRELGADFVIALQPIPRLQPESQDPVGHFLGRARWLTNLLPLGGFRNTVENLDVSIRSFQTLWQRLAVVGAEAADVVIAPDLQRFFFLQFGAAGEIVDSGHLASEEALPVVLDRIGPR